MEAEAAFVKTVHKAAHEAIDYFFDDPEKIKGMLKLDKSLCPASYALYFTLVKKEGFGNFTKDGELKHTDFCHKAIMLFPRMFDMRAPIIVPRLKEIMAYARGRIDNLGKRLLPVKKESSNKDYAKWERMKLIRVRGEEYGRLPIEYLIERLKKRYTKSSRAIKMYEKLESAEDSQFDASYHTEEKGLSYELTQIEDAEYLAILKLRENYVAVEEMKDVLDFYAFLYQDVILSPSVVNCKGENPKLFKSGKEAVRLEFQQARDELEAYHPEICESCKEC